MARHPRSSKFAPVWGSCDAAIPATAVATFAAEKFGAAVDETHMLFAVSGLIGIFWRQALPMVPILGKRWADKQGGAE